MMEEQDIMNAYYSRTAIEVFRVGHWQKAISKDVNVGTLSDGGFGINYVNLLILTSDGFPSRDTEVVARDEFASRLRKKTVDAS